MRNRLFAFLAIVVFVFGVVNFTLSMRTKNIAGAMVYQPTGFTVSMQTTYRVEGQTPKVLAWKTHIERANGEYKEVKTQFYPDGKVESDVSYMTPQGVLHEKGLPDGTVDFMQANFSLPAGYKDENFLRSHTMFNREENVLGIKTFVLRVFSNKEGAYSDHFIAPSLGGYTLKRHRYHPGDDEFTEEAVWVNIGEPSENEFKDFSTSALSFHGAEKKVQMYLENGQKEQAEYLRKQIEEAKTALEQRLKQPQKLPASQ